MTFTPYSVAQYDQYLAELCDWFKRQDMTAREVNLLLEAWRAAANSEAGDWSGRFIAVMASIGLATVLMAATRGDV